ncbi:MAG: serine hydrolase [Myxococcota bacterium]
MKRWFLSLLLLGGAVDARADCPQRDYWPTTEWRSRAELVRQTRKDQIAALESYAFARTGSEADHAGIRTDGVVIIHRGEIIYEKYAGGYSASQRHLSWSVSKSFTNALVGVGVRDGLLSLDDSICKHRALDDEAYCKIRVRDLLTMSSGIDWQETYEGTELESSSVLAMLYGVGRKDMMGFVSSHRLRDAPAETWMYSSGDSTLLAGVTAPPLRERYGDEYPWETLFDPIGMHSATWEADHAGTYVGSSYVYATPRDLAKFGYLFLNDGCWETRRLLPEGWVGFSTKVNEPIKKRPLLREPDDVYGAQFWLNKEVPEIGATRPWPDVPDDAYAARGHWGQSITVIPSRDAVVVRTADDREKGFEFNKFLKLALEVIP